MPLCNTSKNVEKVSGSFHNNFETWQKALRKF